MKIPTCGGFAALAVCAAAAVAAVAPSAAADEAQGHSSGPGDDKRRGAPDLASEEAAGAASAHAVPAAAASQRAMQQYVPAARQAMAERQVPLIVPLETMEATTPLDAPRLTGTVPAMPIAPPAHAPQDGRHLVPDPLLPALSTSGDVPTAMLQAPVPTLSAANRASAARLTTDDAPLKAYTPEASLGSPVSVPSSRSGGRTDTEVPDARLTTPMMKGQPGADLMFAETRKETRMPHNELVSGTFTTVGTLSKAAGSAR